MGVEPTPESAKDTGDGFEDHEDHRAPFASASSIEETPLRAQEREVCTRNAKACKISTCLSKRIGRAQARAWTSADA